jgi:hypothetical protein
MTNGEVLAVVNENFITKNPETSKLSQLLINPLILLIEILWLNNDQGNKMEGP